MNLLVNLLNQSKLFLKKPSSSEFEIKLPKLLWVQKMFLIFLSDEDTTQTFFKDYYTQKPLQNISVENKKDHNSGSGGKNRSTETKNSTINHVGKTASVCSGLIEVCERLDHVKYSLVILSCLAKMKELEKALHKIVKFKCKRKKLKY